MKKVCYLLGFVLCILICANTMVYASTEHYIESGGFSITVPDGCYTLYRNMDNEDPVLSLLGLTPEDVDTALEERDMYLDVIDENGLFEISVMVRESEATREIYNLSVLDDKDIIEIFSEVEGEDVIGFAEEEYGDVEKKADYMEIDKDKLKITTTHQYKIVQNQTRVSMDGEEADSISNVTIVNGKDIHITLFSYDADSIEAGKTVLNSMTDSLSFDEIKENPNSYETTDNNTTTSGTDWSKTVILILGAITVLGVVTRIGIRMKRSSLETTGAVLAYIGLLIFTLDYLYTIYTAFIIKGLLSAFIAFCLPLISTIYWFIIMLSSYGWVRFHEITLLLAGIGGVLLLIGGLVVRRSEK